MTAFRQRSPRLLVFRAHWNISILTYFPMLNDQPVCWALHVHSMLWSHMPISGPVEPTLAIRSICFFAHFLSTAAENTDSSKLNISFSFILQVLFTNWSLLSHSQCSLHWSITSYKIGNPAFWSSTNPHYSDIVSSFDKLYVEAFLGYGLP